MTNLQYFFWLYSTLVPILSTDDFFARDYASHILHENPHPFVLLAVVERSQLEGRIRLRHLQENYKLTLVEDWYSANKNTLPWAKSGHPSAAYLSSPLNKETDDWSKHHYPRWRRATALYLKEYLQESLDFSSVSHIVRELQATEDEYMSQVRRAAAADDSNIYGAMK